MAIQLSRAIRWNQVVAAWLFVSLLPAGPAGAQDWGPDIARELERLSRSDRVETIRIGESPGERAILLARVSGRGADEDRPALLVVAGARAAHRIGTDVALAFIERLSGSYGRDSSVTALLDRATVLVLPQLSPDVAPGSSGGPVRVRTRNDSPFDDDRDGWIDEDAPDDLNGDGLITMMRIADPTGEWTEDEQDPDLMRIADPARGDSRSWRLLIEGVDDDNDGRWNEDPPGGVDVGINFPRSYPWFTEAAGDYPVSAPETRALAELLTSHDEIAAVVVLGTRDNLLSPWNSRPGKADGPGDEGEGRPREPLKTVLAEDAPWFADISRRYLEATGRSASDTLGVEPEAGGPVSWAYFDMGRWSFGSSVWTPPALPDESATEEPTGEDEIPADGAVAPGDGASAAQKGPPGDKSPDDERTAAERRLLRWIQANRPGDFVAWSPVNHPDFPDRLVEVGGLVPYARWTPPAALRDSIIDGEIDFLIELGSLLPRIEIVEASSESLGDGTFRITARIANEGFLPTRTTVGGQLRRPRSIRVDFVTNGQEVASGRKIQTIEAIPGSGAASELSWTVVGRGNGRVTVRAEAPSAGADSREVELR